MSLGFGLPLYAFAPLRFALPPLPHCPFTPPPFHHTPEMLHRDLLSTGIKAGCWSGVFSCPHPSHPALPTHRAFSFFFKMLVLIGFCQVVHQMETRGRFRCFSFRTPEGYHFDGSLWVTEGLLDEPVDGELFTFTGFCPSSGEVSLTAFRRAEGMEPTAVPPTSSVVVGTVNKVQDEDFDLEYMAYDKVTKVSSTISHSVVIRGNHWDKRKVVLRPGVHVQVLGTVEGPSSTDCDNFWVLSRKESTSSPVKKPIANVFAARPLPIKPLVLLSEDEDPMEPIAGSSSSKPFKFSSFRSSSPSPVSVDDEVAEPLTLRKGKGPVTKRQRTK